MSLNRPKSQERGNDQHIDHPDLLIYAHQNFILSLLKTLKTITSENEQNSKEINQLSDGYEKAMKDIFSPLQNLDIDSLADRSRLRINCNESTHSPLIRQIRSDISELKVKIDSINSSITFGFCSCGANI